MAERDQGVAVELEGLGALLDAVRNAASRLAPARPRPDLEVGYAAPYAIYVHENLEAAHPNGGQAKFLEEPLRRNADRLARLAADRVRAGDTLAQALLAAGAALLAESRRLVPVDTGALRDSGYVRVTDGGPAAGEEAAP